jgi:hypothetical protein
VILDHAAPHATRFYRKRDQRETTHPPATDPAFIPSIAARMGEGGGVERNNCVCIDNSLWSVGVGVWGGGGEGGGMHTAATRESESTMLTWAILSTSKSSREG